MTGKKVPIRTSLIDLAARAVRGHLPWSPRASDPATASAALALTIGLLRALRDRGVLSADEIDDVLLEASGRSSRGPEAAAFRHVIEQVRADLERTDDAE